MILHVKSAIYVRWLCMVILPELFGRRLELNFLKGVSCSVFGGVRTELKIGIYGRDIYAINSIVHFKQGYNTRSGNQIFVIHLMEVGL